MAIVAGTKTLGTGGTLTTSAARSRAFQLEVKEICEASEIGLELLSAPLGSVRLALRRDVANTPGEIIEEQGSVEKGPQFTSLFETLHLLKTTQKVWLEFLCSTVWKIKEGGSGQNPKTLVAKGEGSATACSEVTSWGTPQSVGPCAVWVIGTVISPFTNNRTSAAPHSNIGSGTYDIRTHLAARSKVVSEAVPQGIILTHLGVRTTQEAGIAPEALIPPEAEVLHEIVSHAAPHSTVGGFAINGESVLSHAAVHSTVAGFNQPGGVNVTPMAANGEVTSSAVSGEVLFTHLGAHSTVSSFNLPQGVSVTQGAVHGTVTGHAANEGSNTTHAAAHSSVAGTVLQGIILTHAAPNSSVQGGVPGSSKGEPGFSNPRMARVVEGVLEVV